jgi:hypothetical protein
MKTHHSIYRLAFLITILILIVVVYEFFYVKQPIEKEVASILNVKHSKEIKRSNPKKDLEKNRPSNVNNNFFANAEFAGFLGDLPCKKSYLIYNFFSEFIENQKMKSASLRDMVLKLAEDGQFDTAIELANQIEDKNVKNDAIENIIKKLLKVGEIDNALNLAASLDKCYETFPLDILAYLFEIKEQDKALEVAELIRQELPIPNALSDISKELLKSGYTKESLRFANSIEDWKIKAETLNDLAKSIMESGQKELGKKVFQSAIDTIDSADLKKLDLMYSPYDEFEKMEYWNMIAFDLANAGEIEWSKRIFEKSLKMIDSNKSLFFQETEFRDTIVAIIASGHYQWGSEIANNYPNPMVSTAIFCQSAIELINFNKVELAEEYFKRGIDLAYQKGGDSHTYYWFWEYAEKLAKNNNIELSQKYTAKAHEVRKKMYESGEWKYENNDEYNRDLFFRLFDSGNYKKALEIPDLIKDKGIRDRALNSVSDKLSRSGKIEQALMISTKITDKDIEYITLKSISDEMIWQRKYDGFDMLFKRMFEIANSTEDAANKNKFFLDISHLLLNLPCEEQQKYIQQFVTAYDSKDSNKQLDEINP